MDISSQSDVVLPQALEPNVTNECKQTVQPPSNQKEILNIENEPESSLYEGIPENSVESALKNYPTCKGDLELLDYAISAWRDQNSANDLMRKEIKQMQEWNESIKKSGDEKLLDLDKITQYMQRDVDKFHHGLNLTDELHKDLCDLKVKYADLEAKIKAKSDDCIKMQEEHAISINNSKQSHSKELEDTRAEKEKKLKAMEEEYKLRNEKLCEEIEQLKERVKMIEREKQSELSVLKIEYESKIAKLQVKRAAAPPQPQSSVLNQDIFRKKLHHLKLEYEQENNALKTQIRCLQQQLNQKSFGRKSTTK